MTNRPDPCQLLVLVPLDPSKAPRSTTDVAVGIAPPGAVIELVSVTPPDLPPAVVDAFLLAERDRHPDATVAVRRLAGDDVVTALLAHIVDERPDLVVLASHGRGTLGELLLGSVSADLVRSSWAPTVLVGPSCRTGTRMERLVAAVDGSPDSLEALGVASLLSTRFGVPLELVEVADDIAYSSDITESAELHRLAETVDPPVRSWDVLHGHDVARALVDHVGDDPGVVLVLGTHGRSPGRPHVLGGVAARTVRHAHVPVMVVSPQAAAASAALTVPSGGGAATT